MMEEEASAAVVPAGGSWVSLSCISDLGVKEEQPSSKSLRKDHSARLLLTHAGLNFLPSAGEACSKRYRITEGASV